MSLLEVQPAVTSTVTNLTFPLKPTTRLAKPYHYRRNGIYYMRLRATGSTTEAAAVSLKTSNRRDALDASEQLSGFVRAFHLENPEASWSKLKEHFRCVSVELFESGRDGDVTQVWGGLHDSDSGPAGGPTSPLKPGENFPVSLSVLAPAMTFEILSGLYLADRGQDQKTSTLKETKICHGTISTALGELDMRTHTRADLVALRDRLSENRMPSTVNKLLVKLSVVLAWAVDNGHISKSYDKKLKLTKGLESSRKAFTQDQVGKLVTYSNTLPETSWKRWLLSLGAITGGRLNEISQLTVGDVLTLESGITAIHINEQGEGKSIKNKRSERLVPLTDGAYGFDLAAFLRYVEACKISKSESLAQIGYKTAGEWANQQAIPAALGDSFGPGLVFHSMRHSLASLMQAKGVPTTHAQAVMGHASGTITFDTYGSGVPVETLAEMLCGLFDGSPENR
ncbi:tyrosine-type recombinase/integrase [Pseudomonas chlororaphis]|uniref:tyrosine-type recombinase/integrase n=1 Tax=Pseudomonas chlororaphis TaxID=587753 RepID=UPI002366F3EF|nr:tyrosine-type recombinase/integrase [Pseudomonas chlororaphis]WDH23624.1 tyrosine-type recombinase/integrase [Pseudomonas chlororaphis]